MVQYRRSRLAGGTYFFTLTLRDRRSFHLVNHINHLRNAFRAARKKSPFIIHAIVVLPEHLHTIWELPAEDDDYPKRWRFIKSHYTRALVKGGVNLIKNERGEYNLWQRRYWEHQIRDESDMKRHFDYIHYNPVKHRYVPAVSDWPYSSFHRYVKLGWLSNDWGIGFKESDGISYGE